MALPNIFTKEVSERIIERIQRLTPDTPAQWGKMNVAQMLAHCNVTYEMIYTHEHPEPNAFFKFILKTLVKKKVVSEGTYGQSLRTAPQFVMVDPKEFDAEQERLITFIRKTQELGEAYFDGKMSHSFGRLNKTEWNNMFYKHLNHHLTQFGV